ncbi:hypothetical protein QFZ65_002461 [Arthrobacter sp. B3I9]|uniref:hypothetical protein n=1 Tax=Arthrobacter sp. B3I9 TaxID=3042270 RepID=UPI0027943931|nr:hypothetical protein [Arthrobacter sp. B3I9]MDQ0850523.1 hypothetical protein [Arthrobacter sp. B3I9]
MADEKPTNWWATLPGVLTAVAAVITAVTGLLLGLGQLGLFDAAKPATASSPPTGTGPSRPSSPMQQDSPAASASGEPLPDNGTGWAVSLPDERKYRSADVEYEILDAKARPDVTWKISLAFSVRCTNRGMYDINFWDSTFRLNAGGVSVSPDSGLNDLVPADSSKSGEVSFTVPADTRDPVLRIKFPTGESRVQVALSPPSGRAG